MSETSSRVRLMANLQAAVAEAVSGTMEERGRGFASDREAWAELKECIEPTRKCGARSRTGTRTLSPRSRRSSSGAPVFSPRSGRKRPPSQKSPLSASRTIEEVAQMKKLYSKKLGGEAFALDAAQLDILKKAGYTSRRRVLGRMSSLISRPALSPSALGRRHSPITRSAASSARSSRRLS